MATKLQQRYELSDELLHCAVPSAKDDIAWCETAAAMLDRIFVELIEKKVLASDSAYAKQFRSIVNKVRAERAALSEELFDHLEGKEANVFTVSDIFAEREPFIPEGSTLISKNEGMEVYRTPSGSKIVNIG